MQRAAAAALAGALWLCGSCSPAEPTTPAVDDARLLAAELEAESWLLYGRGYAQQRFSPLAAVTRANVDQLRPAWSYRSGIDATYQTTPLVADGTLYATLPGGHVVALDAATGAVRWRYNHALAAPKPCCGPANRGAALGYGKVFVAAPDAQVLALDRANGSVVWRTALAPPDGALGASMAPVVYAGKVFVGVTGAGYEGPAEATLTDLVDLRERPGGRGYLAAFDAETGNEVWRWYSIPEAGWEGRFTASGPGGEPLGRDLAGERERLPQSGEAWRGGGGSVWGTPAVDPELGLIYFGTGNPSPFADPAARPGDNLYTASLVALDARTGALRWYSQLVPHDRWGYDIATPAVLLDWIGADPPRPAVAQATKSGFLYVFDRATGELLVRSEPFVPQDNLFAAPTAEGVRIAPGAAGGASWSPVAYDPTTGWAYVAGLHLPMRYRVVSEGGSALHTELEPLLEERAGTLTAIDTKDGRVRWQVETELPLVGGVLVTAGGLVFTGQGSGFLTAYDAATGEALWQWEFPAGVNAPPITYALPPDQYIAVAVGGHKLFGFPTGDRLVAFALPTD